MARPRRACDILLAPPRIRDFVKYRCMGRRVWIIPVWESVFAGVIKAGTPRERVCTIPNGIDLARATTPSRSKAQIRAELGIAETDRHPHVRNPAIEQRRGPRHGCHGRVDASGSERSAGHSRARELQDFVRGMVGEQRPAWLHVIRPIEKWPTCYLIASVFVSASRSEGFSFAAVEAMANGLPVV